ncbi:MAG: lipase family protein [Hyphomicrobiaceae bacterium]
MTGFSAGVFRHRATGEIVIAYTGTNESKVSDFLFGNVPAAAGEYSPQVLAAMQLYIRVRRQYGDNISFTGHSLGGGLASLMAVYFDRPATVFAPAPFELSATRAPLINDYASRLRVQGLTDSTLDRYLIDSSFIERERNVAAYSIEGEIVTQRLGRNFTIVDPARDFTIGIGASPAAPVDLHSILLHAATLESSQFLEAVRRVPSVASVIFDKTLEARDPEVAPEADFLHRLMRRHWGIEGQAAGQVLDRFAADVLKLAGDTGLAQTQARDALIAAAVEYHYHDTDPTQVFSVAAGHLSFDLGRIVGAGMLPSLSASKALPRLEQAVQPAFGAEQDYSVYLRGKSVWHVQQGAAPMNFTASSNANDAAIGGVGADFIESGVGHDLLVGNAGVDVLRGGEGNDILLAGLDADSLDGGTGNDQLLGGTGFDTYEFAGDFGQDTVIDAGDDGQIRYGGATLPQGLKISANVWASADRQWTFMFSPSAADAGRGTLVIQQAGTPNRITVRNWRRGTLAIDLSDTPLPSQPPVSTTREILGDLQDLDTIRRPMECRSAMTISATC